MDTKDTITSDESEELRKVERDNDLLYWKLKDDAMKDKIFYAEQKEMKDG